MPTIDVYLLADYTHPDSVIKIEKMISEYPVVDEVYYQESILNLINENVKKDQRVSVDYQRLAVSDSTYDY
ncbi:MAG: hypothetical protein MZV63_21965 [Marinilabiliales bacterium]|nr:hypothetical protein [Marinilabiliales bacterium]